MKVGEKDVKKLGLKKENLKASLLYLHKYVPSKNIKFLINTLVSK